MNDDDKKENVLLAFDIASKQIDRQNNTFDVMQSKVGISFGFLSLFFISLLTYNFNSNSSIFIILAILLVAVAIIILVVGFFTKEYFEPLKDDIFYSGNALNKNHINYVNKLVADTLEVYKLNDKNLRLLSKFFDFSLSLFVISLIFLLVSIFEKI